MLKRSNVFASEFAYVFAFVYWAAAAEDPLQPSRADAPHPAPVPGAKRALYVDCGPWAPGLEDRIKKDFESCDDTKPLKPARKGRDRRNRLVAFTVLC